VAIRAIAQLKSQNLPVRLVIAGHGKKEYVDYCRKVVDDLGISSDVSFTGFIENPYDVYLSSDCVIIASKNEALSRVALESMACALPVIGHYTRIKL